MPLPVYDTQDAVPEELREEYAEHEGKWRAKVEIELAVEKKKKATLLNEKKEAERLRAEAEAKRDELQRAADAKAGGITEEQLQKIRDDEAKARKPIEEERDRLAAENRKLKLTDRVKAAALAAGVMPDRIDDAMLVLERRTDLTADGDSIVVKDTKGDIVAGVQLPEFLEKTFKAEKPWLYGGSGASGSGGAGGSGTGGSGERAAPPAEQQVAAKRAAVASAF